MVISDRARFSIFNMGQALKFGEIFRPTFHVKPSMNLEKWV